MVISNIATTRRFRVWTNGSGCACAVFCASVGSDVAGVGGVIISAGPMLSLPRRGCSLLHMRLRRCVNPLGGELPTGEPDAGDPPVRFGGRGSETNRLSLPLSAKRSFSLSRLEANDCQNSSGLTFGFCLFLVPS